VNRRRQGRVTVRAAGAAVFFGAGAGGTRPARAKGNGSGVFPPIPKAVATTEAELHAGGIHAVLRAAADWQLECINPS